MGRPLAFGGVGPAAGASPWFDEGERLDVGASLLVGPDGPLGVGEPRESDEGEPEGKPESVGEFNVGVPPWFGERDHLDVGAGGVEGGVGALGKLPGVDGEVGPSGLGVPSRGAELSPALCGCECGAATPAGVPGDALEGLRRRHQKITSTTTMIMYAHRYVSRKHLASFWECQYWRVDVVKDVLKFHLRGLHSQ